jgi:Kef-type K+ transport system membrane component KefB/mannitol/fructose-specific phosphotransferase system IIA component
MMERLSSADIVALFLGLGVLLAAARLLGGLARRAHQPAVLGEILAGIILGPTVLGRVAPEVVAQLFSLEGPRALVHDGMTVLAITLFLLVAGMEVDLSTMWRQGKAAVSVGWLGMALPFALGLGTAWLAPGLFGMDPGSRSVAFALFFATALSISALPVIAKTLMDLGLYRTDLGMLIVAAAVFNDLVGWIVFAVVLGLMGTREAGAHGFAVADTILLTLGFVVAILTVGRWALDRVLRLVQSKPGRPGAVMSFALASTMLCAAFTEWIGVHAIFGGFLFGVALGDSSHLSEQTRTTMDRFISFFFAPLFFSSIGLGIDFAEHFDLALVVGVFMIACIGKVIGCGVGARIGGLSWPESWAVGFGMNARGAMEIILGLLALESELIGERMFVALVVMALATSMLSGPVIQALLKPRTGRLAFTDHIPAHGFLGQLRAGDRWQAIAELCSVAGGLRNLDPEALASAAIAREKTQGTGLPNGVAIPHCRVPGLKGPIIAVGTSRTGIDFDSADGEPAHLVVLIVTPEADGRSQLEILGDIAATFPNRAATAACAEARDHAEFVAQVRLRSLRNPLTAEGQSR